MNACVLVNNRSPQRDPFRARVQEANPVVASRHWRFVAAMPLTASGKIRKIELENMFAAH